MEIVGIWIKKYKQLKEQYFPMSFRYSYTQKNKSKKIEIKLERREYIPDDFFGRDSTVTCIVGINGSGKTTLMEAVLSLLNYTRNPVTSGSCLVIKENEKYKLLGYPEDFTIFDEFGKVIGESKKIFTNKNSPMIEHFPTVFYSPIAHPFSDFSSINTGSKMINVSSHERYKSGWNRSIASELKDQFDFFAFERNLESSIVSDFDRRFIFDVPVVSKQALRSFVSSVFNDMYLIKKKKWINYLLSSFGLLDDKFFLGSTVIEKILDQKILVKELNEIITFSLEHIVDAIERVEGKGRLKNAIARRLLLSKIVLSTRRTEPLFRFAVFCFLHRGNFDYKILEITFEEMNLGEEPSVQSFRKAVEESWRLSSAIEGALPISKRDGLLPVQFEPDEFVACMALRNAVPMDLINKSICIFKWKGVSTGELAKVNLFARLLHGFKLISRNKGKDSVVLLLDEADIYLHPEWQRLLISELLEHLPQISPYKKIHIIITTHSPIVLSDLPSEAVVFLGGKKQDRKLQNSFASNIHEIYWEGFFVSSTMGAYAQNKITEVVVLLDNEKMSESQLVQAKKIINLVGDGVLKSGLMAKIEEKTGREERKEQLVKKIRALNNELKRLENQ